MPQPLYLKVRWTRGGNFWHQIVDQNERPVQGSSEELFKVAERNFKNDGGVSYIGFFDGPGNLVYEFPNRPEFYTSSSVKESKVRTTPMSFCTALVSLRESSGSGETRWSRLKKAVEEVLLDRLDQDGFSDVIGVDLKDIGSKAMYVDPEDSKLYGLEDINQRCDALSPEEFEACVDDPTTNGEVLPWCFLARLRLKDGSDIEWSFANDAGQWQYDPGELFAVLGEHRDGMSESAKGGAVKRLRETISKTDCDKYFDIVKKVFPKVKKGGSFNPGTAVWQRMWLPDGRGVSAHQRGAGNPITFHTQSKSPDGEDYYARGTPNKADWDPKTGEEGLRKVVAELEAH